MKPRILFGGLYHETHGFISETTSWSAFDIITDNAVLEKIGDESPTAGFLEEAARYDWEVIPTLDARALPSGPVEDAAFERYWNEFEQRARPALAFGVNAIFLVLHGAMTTQSLNDAEGEFLTRLRALPGAHDLPVFGVLDLHANVTARMCQLAEGLVTYRKNPHTDAKHTAKRAAALLKRCLDSKQKPRMQWCRVPMIIAPPGTGSASDPLLSLNLLADKLENQDRELWAMNIAMGFSFADTPETGLTLSAIYTSSETSVRAHLSQAADLAWKLRSHGLIEYPSVDTILAAFKPESSGPVILIEPSDNIGAGAPGDGTGVLRSLLKHKIPSALLAINDPGAVERLAQIPLHSEAQVTVGGHGWAADEGPVTLRAQLISRSDGCFKLEDPNSHLASMSGLQFNMGPSAVIESQGITLLITSRKTPPFDLGQFRSQGIEPKSFKVIGVKAAVAHRRAYDPIAAASYFVDTPGPCSSDLSTFRFSRLHRPIYPLDRIDQPTLRFS